MRAIEFAIQMELDGEKYYLEQAEKADHAALRAVFTLLAAEEHEHADLLKKHAAQTDYQLHESKVPARIKGIFDNEKDLQIAFKERPEQLDAYRLALSKEKESIELYEKMRSDATSEEERSLFEFLVEQEKIHYNTFQHIIEHVMKAKQWVEAAEFGLREDY